MRRMPCIGQNGCSCHASWRWSKKFWGRLKHSVLYSLCRHAAGPEEAVVRAVNDTKDNDSIAAIVGVVVGALHGKAGLPHRWIEGLLGRTGADDDGHTLALIAQAREMWWAKESA